MRELYILCLEGGLVYPERARTDFIHQINALYKPSQEVKNEEIRGIFENSKLLLKFKIKIKNQKYIAVRILSWAYPML
jgi:hypothetical protein